MLRPVHEHHPRDLVDLVDNPELAPASRVQTFKLTSERPSCPLWIFRD
jgi:hypothetical protein